LGELLVSLIVIRQVSLGKLLWNLWTNTVFSFDVNWNYDKCFVRNRKSSWTSKV